MSEKFTCVFEFEISKFEPNPFHVDTPFGKPETISRGDVCERNDILHEQLAASIEKIAVLETALDEIVRMGAPGASFVALTALRKVINQ